MTTFEDEIREALRAEFDTGSLKEAGTADEIFRLIKDRYPISGSKIDWRRVPGAIRCFEDIKSKRPERFIRFFDEACAQFELKGPVFYAGDSATDFALAGSIQSMRRALPELIDIPQHHYFVGPNASWCFCFTMEGDMDFGSVAAAPLNYVVNP